MNDYVSALRLAGFEGECILCAPGDDAEEVAGIHGLLLCGGLDIHPRLWDTSEALHPTAEVDDARDALEGPWVRQAWAAQIPILGICRGEQMLNVALGGSLLQDIPDYFEIPGERHRFGTHEDTQPHHDITVEPQSRLGRILGVTRISVNSRHHQAVSRLAPGLKAVAWDPETCHPQSGPLIEAIEAENPASWAMGVQWHPENLVHEKAPHGEAALRVFQAFVQAVTL